jgi:hypothetical protein
MTRGKAMDAMTDTLNGDGRQSGYHSRRGAAIWLTDSNSRNAVRLALNLVPFAGIAFLWFMGLLRNRVGTLEDQFFATVFLGSGLLFLVVSRGCTGVSHYSEPGLELMRRCPA